MSRSALRAPLSDPGPDLDMQTLAFLRVHGARTRCLARSDVFTCCAATLCDKACPVEMRAVALLRALSAADALGALRFYEPGAREVSFDEHWLMSALSAAARDDTDSLTFLLARRLPQAVRRQIGALTIALSRALHRRA